MKLSSQTEYVSARCDDFTAVKMVCEAGFDAVDYSMFAMQDADNILNTPSYKSHVLELKKLAERDTMAAIRYAMLIERKKQAESNKIWETQFSALQQLAQKNNPQACLFLATAYRFGKVVERNSETASQWRKKYLTLRKAALLKDDPCSMLEELVICLQKQSAMDANFTELLKKLQKNGSITATELLKRIKNEP
jgi:hypothetical protein